MRNLNQRILFCGVGLAALVTVPAQAQQAPGEPGTQSAGNVAAPPNEAPGEIVVTAQRRAEALQDVPMSIDVATGEQIQRLNLFDAKDVQQLSPGLQLTNNAGRNNTATLRGISFDPDQGTSPAVDIYLNDVPIDAQTAFTAIYDVDQIEVLRGPQGALRGRTAPAGAITIRTRRPSVDDISGYFQLTGTDDRAYNGQGGVSLPLIPGKLGLRVAALVDGNRLNQVYNVNRDAHSRSRTQSGRFSLLWTPTERLNVNLMYQYLYADNRFEQQVTGPGAAPLLAFPGQRSGPAAAASDYIAVQEGRQRFENNNHFVNLAADYDLDFATLSFNGGYQHAVLRQLSDMDKGNAVPGYQAPQFVRTPYKVKNAELRLDSSSNEFWSWSVSSTYSKQTGGVRVRQQSDVFFSPFTSDNLPIDLAIRVPVFTESYSFAGSSRFQLTDKLRFEVGVRYSRLHNRQASFVTVSSPGYPPFFIPPIPPSTSSLVPADLAETKNKPLTGGGTLTYEFSPAVTAYAAYGRSFRGGTAGVGVPQNISGNLVKTDKETSNNYEVGIKTSLLDRRLSVNVSAFYQTFKGFISRALAINYDNGAVDATGNASGAPDGRVDGSFDFNFNGDAKVKGIEATIAGRPTDNWDFSVSGSYVHARFSNALAPCNDFNGDGRPDSVGQPKITGGGNVSYCRRKDRIGDVPDFNLTANSEIRFPIGDYSPYVRGLFTYRPSFYSNTASFDYSDREILNVYVGIRGPDARWDLSVFAKNILNQNRVTNINQGNAVFGTGNQFDPGYRLVNTTVPREVGVTAQFNF